MKKNYTVVICAILASLSQTTFASRARMEALGQNADTGPYYFNDTTSVFLNPSKIANYKNFIITEWGTANNSTANSSDTPHAEGGIFRNTGMFSWGAYLGNDLRAQNDKKDTSMLKQDNRADIFFGGFAGYEWGARVNFASSSDNSAGYDKTNQAIGFGFGGKYKNAEAYLNTDLKDQSKGGASSGDFFKSKLGIQLGGSIDIDQVKIFTQFTQYGYDKSVASVVSNEKQEEIRLGIGNISEINSSSKVFTDASIVSTSSDSSALTPNKTKYLFLPITIGFEVDVLTWLSLRGSVKHEIIGHKTIDSKKSSRTNTTNVGAGATIKFDKVFIEGVVGNTNRAGNEGEQGILSTDKLLARVSLQYWF